jgi:hypothetical protein
MAWLNVAVMAWLTGTFEAPFAGTVETTLGAVGVVAGSTGFSPAEYPVTAIAIVARTPAIAKRFMYLLLRLLVSLGENDYSSRGSCRDWGRSVMHKQRWRNIPHSGL